MDASSPNAANLKTLLLVDDQEPTRQAMAELLKREGFHILHAPDADVAMETLHAVHVDLAVVDQMPPKMAGWRLLEALEKATLDVPVIVISDYLPQEKKDIPARTPAGLLTKPIQLDDLLGLVRRTLFPPPPGPRQRILVVDDEEDMRLLISTILERAGFEVETASSGERAVEQVKDRPPDLILLDLMMPRMHGVELTISPVRTGETWVFNAFIQDITEHQKAQHRLRVQYSVTRVLSESPTLENATPKILQAICESLEWELGALWHVDRQAGVLRCVEVWRVPSGTFSEFEALTRRTVFLPGVGLPGRVWTSGQPAWISDVTRDANFPRAPIASAEGLHGAFAFPISFEDETLGVMEFFSHKVHQPDEDLLRMMSAAGGQISQFIERKRSEEALQALTSLQRAILDSANYSIISTDPDGAIRTFNKGAERLLGYAADEIVGKVTPAILHDPEEVARRAQALSLELERPVEPEFEAFVAKARLGGPDENEWTYIRKDGSRFPVLLSVTALRDGSGNITGFLGVGSDITERKEVDRMKSEFVSTVSHELRTPLTSIRGSLGLIAGGVVGQIPLQAAPLIDIALNNCERLVRLINDILDMEKIESGKMGFDLKPLKFTPLIEQAIEANRGYGEKFNVGFVLENPLPDVQVNADADRLTQVLTNLLSNAAKFSPSGQTVTVSMSRRDGTVRVCVADRGPGIPEEFRRRIFQKFAQADASDTRQKGGTGLGLSISKAIVERHGGQIGFDTEEGKGTTFYFDLPEHVVAPPVVAPADALHRPRVLICEDDHDVATLLNMMLTQEGFNVDVAHSAEQTRQMLTEGRYDALTLDIMLPGQDGISLIRELRGREETRYLPIVVVSAKAVEGRREINGDAIAVIDWIQKPIDQGRLSSAIRQATRRVSDRRPRILHVEDDPDVSRFVSTLVRDLAEVVHARSIQEAGQRLEQEEFDLIILDLTLPDGSGLDLLHRLHRQTPPVPVLVFSATEINQETMQKIAAALVKSNASNEKLLETIRSLIKESA